jgi:hypothetical protein
MPPSTDLVEDILAPGNFEGLEALLSQLHHVSGFDLLFQRGLGKHDPDEPILAIFAELAALRYLVESGYSDVEVQARGRGKTADFLAQFEGQPSIIEVKALHREESQNKLGTILGGVYVFAPAPPSGRVDPLTAIGVWNTAIV